MEERGSRLPITKDNLDWQKETILNGRGGVGHYLNCGKDVFDLRKNVDKDRTKRINNKNKIKIIIK